MSKDRFSIEHGVVRAYLACSALLGWSGCRHPDNKVPDAGPVAPSNVAPIAVIADLSGASTGQARPLCSTIQLSAEPSTFPAGDQIRFDWNVAYSGSDPSGPNVQLVPCVGAASAVADQHRCLIATAPGTYTVTMSITDTPPGGGAANMRTSPPATFVVVVDVDTPPCLQRTDPDVGVQRILLSRGADLGSTYQSRTLKVLGVADDCSPYPAPADGSGQPIRFVWSVYDATKLSQWVDLTDATDSLTVSQAMFPNALPGDSVKVRVEVRDAAAEKLHQAGIDACPADTDLCCGASACTGSNDCVRWATWTVQLQP